LVEGVHFELYYTPLNSLGWKSLAVNISDIISMGGLPVCSVVTLGLPEEWEVEQIDALYEGIQQCARTYNCPVVGGDTIKSPSSFFISVAVIGEVKEGYEIKRSGANEGDLICVTGELGGSSTGREVLSTGNTKNEYPICVKRFLEPNVRLKEIRMLQGVMKIHSMIDISDGLSSEIIHLCRASGLGCLIQEENIPLLEEARPWAEARGIPLLNWALSSGEEYELLFTVDRGEFYQWQTSKRTDDFVKVTIIGEMISPDEGFLIERVGAKFPLIPSGWDHFS
jgi:thiamine-monophosphate kinase